MDHGKILAEGSLAELKRQAGEEDLVTIAGTFAAEAVRERLEAVRGARVMSIEDGKAVVSAGGEGRGSVDLLAEVFAADISVESISIKPPSLNSLFLNLTGRELRDG
jgi:ABC-2 type transport system ATP-binding protein